MDKSLRLFFPKHKICQKCSKEFISTGTNQKYCKECGILVRKEQIREWTKQYPERTKQIQEKHNHSIGKKYWYKIHCNEVKKRSKQWQKDNREKYLESKRKTQNKRNRGFDSIPLNEWFEGSVGHHIDRTYIIYIPKEVHISIWHSVLRNKNMNEINVIAWNYV